MWGFVWLVVAFIFFGLGILVGLVAFKQNVEQQKADSARFLPVPGSKSSGGIALASPSPAMLVWAVTLAFGSAFGLL